MQIKKIDLHHKNAEEALTAVQASIDFMVKHNEVGVAFDHGKGIHSKKVAVLRQEIRRMLEDRSDLNEAGYIVIGGDEQHPVADAFNEGYVLVVKQEYLNESTVEGDKQREKVHIVWSEEGKEIRKNAKKRSYIKRNKKSPSLSAVEKKARRIAKEMNNKRKKIDVVQRIKVKHTTKNVNTQVDSTENLSNKDSFFDNIDFSDIIFLKDVRPKLVEGIGALFFINDIIPEHGVLVCPNLEVITQEEKDFLSDLTKTISIVDIICDKSIFIGNEVLPAHPMSVGQLIFVYYPIGAKGYEIKTIPCSYKRSYRLPK